MINILTAEEVRQALYLDPDYDANKLANYSQLATSYVFQKTGYLVKAENEIEPIAKQLAELYLKSNYYGDDGTGMNEHLDYTVGINSLIKDLEDIVNFGGGYFESKN